MSYDSDESLVKLVAAVGALTICGGIALYNCNKSDDKIKAIDAGPSTIFNSVAECMSHKNTQDICNSSHGIANSDSHSLGTRITYSFKLSCEKEHGNTCEYHYRRKGSFYSPTMMAWQVRKDNIQIAVPLYGTTHPGEFMRTDKKIISAALAASAPSPEGVF